MPDGAMTQIQDKARKIFLEAIELSADKQWEFIQSECGGQSELVDAIQGLMNARKEEATVALPQEDGIEATIAQVDVGNGSPNTSDGSNGLRYRIVRPHAKGGLGEVSVAKDLELNRDVALKEIQSRFADDEASRSRFLLEAEVTGGLEHPGIVPVYGLGRYNDGRPYYAMRFIQGDSLQDAADRFHQRSQETDGPPDFNSVEFRKLLGRFVDVCQAIEYAHSRGVLHRDLKPGNIMLGKYGETLVVDWGLAKPRYHDDCDEPDDRGGEPLLRPASASGSAPTMMGSAIGTPAFMPPEQAAGKLDELGTQSDVYSLGATLYYMLTGRAPVQGRDLGVVLENVRTGRFPAPRDIQAGIPKALEAVCQSAMSTDAGDRYQSPQVLADEIERFLADEPVHVYTEPLVLRLRRWLRKHQTVAASTAAVVLVTVAGLAVFSSIVSGKNAELTTLNGELDSQNIVLTDLNTKLDDRNEQLDNKNEQLTAANERVSAAAAAAKASAESERKQRDRAERALYLSDLGLAKAFLDDEQQVETLGLLLNHYPRIDQQDRRGWEWHYLLGRAEPSLASWVASQASIPSIDWSSNGSQLATVQMGGRGAVIWNVASGKPTMSIRIGRTMKLGVDWHPAGDRIAFGSAVNDAVVRIADLQSEQITTLKEDTGSLLHVRWSPDGDRIVVGCMNINWLQKANNLVVWQREGGKWRTLGKTRLTEGSGVDGVEWSPTGEELLVVGRYGFTSVIDPATMKILRRTPERVICSAAWHPTEPRLACGKRSGEILILDSKTMKVEQRIAAHLGDVNSVAWSPDGSFLASGGRDRSVKIWSFDDFTQVGRFVGHRGAVNQVCWHPDSIQVASCGIDGQIKVWPREDPPAQTTLASLEDVDGGARARFLWIDDETIRISRTPGEIVHCDVGTDSIKRSIDLPKPGQLLSTGRVYRRANRDVIVSAVETNSEPNESGSREITLESTRYVWPNLHSDNSVVYCKMPGGVVASGTYLAKDLRTGSETKLGKQTLTKIGDVQWSPNEEWIVAVGGGMPLDGGHDQYAGWVNLFDAKSGQVAKRARVGNARVLASSVAWRPDSKRLVVGNEEGQCQIYETPSLKTTLRKRIHRLTIRSLSWHPTEDRVASGADDGRLMIWDADTGDVLLTFEIERPIRQVAWSPKGTKLAAMDSSGKMLVWNAQAGLDVANSRRLGRDLVDQFSQQMTSSLSYDTETALDAAREMMDIGEEVGPQNCCMAALAGALQQDHVMVRRCSEIIASKYIHLNDLRSASLSLWSLVAMPNSLVDYQPAIDAAHRILESDPTDRQFQLCLALCFLRAEREEAALRQLASAASAKDNGRGSPSYLEYVQAIASFQQGNRNEGEKHLAEANRLWGVELAQTTLTRLLIVELLKREAEQLKGEGGER